MSISWYQRKLRSSSGNTWMLELLNENTPMMRSGTYRNRYGSRNSEKPAQRLINPPDGLKLFASVLPSPVSTPGTRKNLNSTASKIATAIINMIERAAPYGQFPAIPNWDEITIPNIVPFKPPTIDGVM
ncbi:hypothetical protein D3C75_774100 [compost metagenome]